MQTHTMGRSIAAVIAIAGLFVAGACHVAHGQEIRTALDAAIKDAHVIVAVPDISAFSDKLAMINDVLGLNNPELGNALGAVKQQLGMNQGVNERGAFVLVLQDVGAMSEVETAQYALLVPVTDYGEFLGNYDVQAVDEVARITMPEGHTAYVRSITGFAVIGPNEQYVRDYTPDGASDEIIEHIGTLGRQYLADNDVTVIVNIESMGPVLLAQIEQMGGGLAVTQPYTSIVKRFLGGTRVMVIGFDATSQGIGLTQTFAFNPDSNISEVYRAGGNAAPGLAWLADQRYLVAGAVDMQGFDLAAMLQRVNKGADEAEQATANSLIQQIMPSLENVSAMAMAIYVSGDPADAAAGAYATANIVTVMRSEQPALVIKGFTEHLETLNQVQVELPITDVTIGKPARLSFVTGYTPNVLVFEGVSVNQYEVTTNLPPAMLGGPAGGMLASTGLSNLRGYVAQADKMVIWTTVLDAQLIKRAIRTAVSGDGMGKTGNIAQIRAASLPPEPTMEMYFDVAGLAALMNAFRAPMGLPLFEIPRTLPPIAMAMSVDKQGAAGRLYLPVDALSFGRAMFAQPKAAAPANRQGQQGLRTKKRRRER